MCRADLRREERKEERRRRRAEGGNASIASSSASSSRGTLASVASTSSSSRVPDLVGGSHSRNASVASSRTSFSSTGGLSRQCSNASTSSRRGHGGGVHVDTVIMEDEDEEEEWLISDTNYETKYPLPSAPKYRVQQYPHPHQRRRPSVSKTHGHGQGKKKLEPFGMGKDMRDVLEEIIQMEKEFVIDETSDDQIDRQRERQEMTPGVFTAVFDRPPRTPSPALDGKRESVVPGAPLRGAGGYHRKSVSMAQAHTHAHGHVASPPPIERAQPRPRPPSTYGHSASLSESHTALYLATASPESGRRSASPPRLKARNSMTFTPESAGPVIPGFLNAFGNGHGHGYGHSQSPNLSTPSRRRPIPSPSAHHPTMSGWRFPHSNTATPTKLTIDTQNLEVRTPRRARPDTEAETEREMHPHLLWPPNINLAPSLFPSSPGMNGTPIHDHDHDPASRFRQQVNTSPTASTWGMGMGMGTGHHLSPPNSGVRLGYLLGSGDEDVDMSMDMDDTDDQSTVHGHGHGHVDHRGYLPVYLREGRSEGFRPT